MIRDLMQNISDKNLLLPEIQRSYVWKARQISGLVDSLYRDYPSGSLLFWETTESITDKALDSTILGYSALIKKPLYLLDGQQRLTSLHRLFTGHLEARVVFDVATETFRIENNATRQDPKFVLVCDLLNNRVDLFARAQLLSQTIEGLDAQTIHQRLSRVSAIGDKSYYYEKLIDVPYAEITEIFVRVNSRGRALKQTDLALAVLSARWPGVAKLMDELIKKCGLKGFTEIGSAFVVQALAAFATETTNTQGFAGVSIDRLETSWKLLSRGIEETLGLLTDELKLDGSRVLPSVNALIPLVFYMGSRGDKPLTADEKKSLIYWFLIATVRSRYSRSATTVIAQDISALKSEEPLVSLLRNLGLTSLELVITEEMLVGRGAGSPYFMLSYLVARHSNALDWWYSVPIRINQGRNGIYRIEYHHIHPKKTLSGSYEKSEINDLANLAFISNKANGKIRARSPKKYFLELEAADPEFLSGHFVPKDEQLRSADKYLDFVSSRRKLLAEAMSKLLAKYCPVTIIASDALSPTQKRVILSVQCFGSDDDEAGDVQLHVIAESEEHRFEVVIPCSLLFSMLDDVANGLATELNINGDVIPVEVDDESVILPLGSLNVSGSISDWHTMLQREMENLLPIESLPTVAVTSFSGARTTVGVLEAV